MTCMVCGEQYTPELMQRPDWDEKLAEYNGTKGHIQDIWPDATAAQREQLLSGICSDKCWNNANLGDE